MSSDESRPRVGLNEAFFREVNEALESGSWPGEEDKPAAFRCECAKLGCNVMIEVTIRNYERVRGNPRRFIVARGHEVPDAEIVVETHEGYLVVEKQNEAGDVADATDPRR